MKRRVNPGLGVGAFSPAERTIQGYEALPMLRKGQIEGLAKGAVRTQNRVMNQMFGLAASRVLAQPLLTRHSVFATRPRLLVHVQAGATLVHDRHSHLRVTGQRLAWSP